MFQDGYMYVLELKSVDYKNDYFGLRSKVKLRTCDKDTLSKLGYYNPWVIMKKIDGGSVQSAYC